MASQSARLRPASASNSCTIGKMDWEWVRTPDDARERTASPRSKAQDASSEEVSIASMVDIAYFTVRIAYQHCRVAQRSHAEAIMTGWLAETPQPDFVPTLLSWSARESTSCQTATISI